MRRWVRARGVMRAWPCYVQAQPLVPTSDLLATSWELLAVSDLQRGSCKELNSMLGQERGQGCKASRTLRTEA